MRKIGYARVSSSSQNLDRQIGALRAERCHEVYREKASGKAVKGRPQLEKAIDPSAGVRARDRRMGPRHSVDDGWRAYHRADPRTGFELPRERPGRTAPRPGVPARSRRAPLDGGA